MHSAVEAVPSTSLGNYLIAYQLHMPFIVWDDGRTSWERRQRAMIASCYSANDFERHHALNVLFCASLVDRTVRAPLKIAGTPLIRILPRKTQSRHQKANERLSDSIERTGNTQ
jgi:hypothetical protein